MGFIRFFTKYARKSVSNMQLCMACLIKNASFLPEKIVRKIALHNHDSEEMCVPLVHYFFMTCFTLADQLILHEKVIFCVLEAQDVY